jgi:hypothetical protein
MVETKRTVRRLFSPRNIANREIVSKAKNKPRAFKQQQLKKNNHNQVLH